MKIRLSREDVERLGCPEVVEYDERKLMGREAVAIQKQTGWTPEKLARSLEGKVVLDDDGKPAYQRDADGVEVLDEYGRRIPLRDVDAEALLILAWIAVRRSVDVAYADFDLDLFGAEFDYEEPGEVEPGKAPAS